jgi:hypothetical protein
LIVEAMAEQDRAVRVLAFHTTEGRARDVSREFAAEIVRRADIQAGS